MEDERQPPAAAVSKVLDDDDLLIEILLRVGFPTTLVRAALVCKRWLGHISDRAFLRRFRELHPPRLLGFYVDELEDGLPRFVPMLPQPPELAAVVRHASFGLDVGQSHVMYDCRNGSVLISSYGRGCTGLCTELSPLSRCPKRCVCISRPVPDHKLQAGCYCSFSQVFSNEEDDVISYFYLYVRSTKDWSFSTIQLPQGVEHGERGTTMLARADNASGVYLIHVEEFQLCIWLHKVDNWLPVDTICMRDMCANLRISDCVDEDEHTALLINQVGDYAESVFFKMGRYALHLDIKSTTLCKVYEIRKRPFTHLGNVYPFLMIWPPKFPALKSSTKKKDTKTPWDDIYIA